MYEPKPLNTSGIELSGGVLELTERLAEDVHEIWASQRMAEGWTYGPSRDDRLKQHPNLVPYVELTEAEKEYDRATALGTLKTILALGWRVER